MTISLFTSGVSPVSSGTTLSTTTTKDIPVGSLVVVLLGYRNVPPGPTFNGDGTANVYTLTDTAAISLGSAAIAAFYSLTTVDIPSGSTLSFSTVVNQGASFIYAAFSVSTGVLDVSVSASGSSTSPAVNSGTLAVANELLLGFTAGVATATTTYSQSSDFLNIGTCTVLTGDICLFGIDYATPAATTSVHYRPTISPSSVWISGIVSFEPGVSTPQTASVGQAQSIHDKKQAGKRFSIYAAEKILATKAIARIFSVFENESVSKGLGFFRKYSISDSETISLTVNLPRDIPLSSPETVNNKNTSLKVFSVSVFQTVNLLKLLSKLVGINEAEVVNTNRTAAHVSKVSSASAQAASDKKLASKGFSVGSSEVVAVITYARRVFLVNIASFEVIGAVKSIARKTSAAQTQTVNLLKSTGRILSISSNETISILFSNLKNISSHSTQSISVLPSKIWTHSTAIAENNIASAKKSINLIRSTLTAQTVNIARAIARRISVVSAEFITALKSVLRFIRVVSAEAVNVLKSATKIIRISESQFITFTRFFPYRVFASSTESVSQFNEKVKIRAYGTGQGQSISLVRNTLYVVSVAGSQVINLGRAVIRNISVFGTEVISVFKTAGREISSISIQIVHVIPSLAHLISVAQAQLVNLLSNYYHRRRMAIWMRKQKRFN